MHTLTNFFKQVSLNSLLLRLLFGAVLGFILISFFVFGVDNPNPDWGDNWKIKPLIITPLVVAFGTLALYLKYIIQFQTKIMNDMVYLFSIILFIISIWMGIILGLNGTMWN